MTLNGATGLIVVPDGHVAWEESKFGVDVGYGFVWGGGNRFDHLPRAVVSLFNIWEVSVLFHIGDDYFKNLVLGSKVKIFNKGGTAMAIGGDFEFSGEHYTGNSSKIYLATTYGGRFFNMPAVTTATIGWQLLESGRFSSQFIYGMGFSLGLFGDNLNNILYWVTDFANFSYAVQGSIVNSGYRGAFNTGLRIRPFQKGRFNMIIDIMGTDLLDDGGRGLNLSVSGGMAF
jgi:hypothetical protein